MNKIWLKLDKDNLDLVRDNPYIRTNLFTIIGESSKKDEITPLEPFDSCREIICDHLRTRLSLKKSRNIKKTRLLVYTKIIAHAEGSILDKKQKSTVKRLKLVYEKEMLVGLKSINLLEKKFKWPITKIYSVECKQLDKNNIFYYFVGSKKWIKSPSLFSLFMLLIRIGQSIKKCNTFRTLDGFHKSLYANRKTLDIDYMRAHYKRCLLIIKYYDKLFGRIPMKNLYIPDTNKNLFIEGINTLCDLDTEDLVLRKKLTTILNKEKKLERWEEVKTKRL